MKTSGISALILTSSIFSSSILAEDWLFFRGPQYNGISQETDWNPQFPKSGAKIAWKTKVGTGASSCVVSGDNVITMGNKNDYDYVSCLNAETGKPKWTFKYKCEFEKRMFEGGTAATPTIDGEFVYTLSHLGQLHCLKLSDGSKVWEKNLVDDFKGKLTRWKYSCSPLIYKDMLILDAGSKSTSTLALDKKTGKKIWGKGKDKAGYASPIPFSIGSTEAVLVFKAKAMVAHELKSGKELWRIPWETSYDVNASSPSVRGDKLMISSGYKDGRVALFQLSENKKPVKLWQNDDVKTKMSSCVIVEDHIYGVSSEEGGKLYCVDMKNGKTQWTSPKGLATGSLTAAGDKLIVFSGKGSLMTVEANPKKYKLISEEQVLGGTSYVNPVLANGRIYCKNNKGQLVCVDVRK